MKKIFFVLAAAIAVVSCTEADNQSGSTNDTPTTNSSVTADNATAPNTTNITTQAEQTSITKIEWLDGTTRDLGKMKEGDSLKVTFRFKNTGDKPLIIRDVQAGCGCTATDKPTKPFAPGETGEIKALFNSQNQGTGAKSKNVNVFANTEPEMTTLIFRVDVKPKS